MQALRNNALATRTVARLAARHGVERFVLDLDRQGREPEDGDGRHARPWPSGSSRRSAQVEHETTLRRGALRQRARLVGLGRCRSSAIRSRAAGRSPSRDPEMTRYFMTIPEAAQLIVQAGGVGRGGEMFVLDMGDPVRILDLAHDMIRLSGLEPERDIAGHVRGRPARREAARRASSRIPRRSSARTTTSSCAPAARRSRPNGSRASCDAVERLANEGDETAALERVRAMIANPRRADSEQPAVAGSGLSRWIRASSQRCPPSWSGVVLAGRRVARSDAVGRVAGGARPRAAPRRRPDRSQRPPRRADARGPRGAGARTAHPRAGARHDPRRPGGGRRAARAGSRSAPRPVPARVSCRGC